MSLGMLHKALEIVVFTKLFDYIIFQWLYSMARMTDEQIWIYLFFSESPGYL